MAGQSYPVEILLNARDQASAVLKNVGTAAQQGLGKLGGLAGSITPEMGRLGTQATVAGGAIVGALGLAGNASVQYGKQIAEVGTLSSDARDRLGEYRTELLKMGAEYGQSTDALAKGLYDSISAGIDAGDAIQFMGDASKLAIAGVTDVSTSVDLLTSVLNAYGEEATEAAHYSDVMFGTVQAGKTTITELAGVVGQVAPMANSAGVSIEEVGSALATLTAQGLSTAEAGTQLRGLIMSLLKPSEELSAVLAEAGYSSGEAAIKAEGFEGVLRILNDAAGGSAEIMGGLIPNVRGMGGALILTSNDMQAWTEKNAIVQESAGQTSKAFEHMSSDAAFSIARARESFKAAAIAIGDSVTTILAPLASVVASIGGFIASNQWLAGTIAVVGGVIGSLLLVFGGFVKAMQLIQAVTVAVATVKTWYATVTGAAAAADGAAAAASLGDAAAKGVQAAATDMATIAATANAAAMTGAAAAAGGAAAASVTAGVTMVAAMLPVIAVLAAVLAAILSVRRTWEEYQKFKDAKVQLKESLAGEAELEAMREFQLAYKAKHGSTEGWMAAWESTSAARTLRSASEAASARRRERLGSRGGESDMDSIMAQAQAAMKQSEELQKSLPAMTTSQASTAQAMTALPAAAASLSTLPTLGTAVAAPSVAVQAAQPLQLSLALDWGLIISNWSEISARHDWQVSVAPAY